MDFGILVIVIFGILILWFIYIYNAFASRQRRIDEWWDEVDAHLKLRHDLLPKLIGKARQVLSDREDAMNRIAEINEIVSSEDEDAESLENGLSLALQNFKAELKENPAAMLDMDFVKLMGELVSIEGRASSACREHNMLVGDFNSAMKRFPASLVVGLLHFNPRERRIFVNTN
jgi:LemA protein